MFEDLDTLLAKTLKPSAHTQSPQKTNKYTFETTQNKVFGFGSFDRVFMRNVDHEVDQINMKTKGKRQDEMKVKDVKETDRDSVQKTCSYEKTGSDALPHDDNREASPPVSIAMTNLELLIKDPANTSNFDQESTRALETRDAKIRQIQVEYEVEIESIRLKYMKPETEQIDCKLLNIDQSTQVINECNLSLRKYDNDEEREESNVCQLCFDGLPDQIMACTHSVCRLCRTKLEEMQVGLKVCPWDRLELKF